MTDDPWANVRKNPKQEDGGSVSEESKSDAAPEDPWMTAPTPGTNFGGPNEGGDVDLSYREPAADYATGRKRLMEPFEPNLIGKLPKPFKKDSPRSNCRECGGFHGAGIHLDFVGHAALTHRLLEVDPEWNWEPLAFTSEGLPLLDKIGGMWIRLTVCGVTRLGYGHPDGKTGGNAIKEVIGDALRNAAMRFGAALALWHKGDLYVDPADGEAEPEQKPKSQPKQQAKSQPKQEQKSTANPDTPPEVVKIRKEILDLARKVKEDVLPDFGPHNIGDIMKGLGSQKKLSEETDMDILTKLKQEMEDKFPPF